MASTNLLIVHPDYNNVPLNNDIAIIRIIGEFSFNDNVGVASIASYIPTDNSPVWAVGWGSVYVSLFIKIMITNKTCNKNYLSNNIHTLVHEYLLLKS